MTDKAFERLWALSQEAIERDRRAFQDEMALARAKLAEREREIEARWRQVNPPTLEPKSEPVPAVTAPEPTPAEVPRGLIDLSNEYNAIALSAIIENALKGKS